jgi:hypothetical protein
MIFIAVKSKFFLISKCKFMLFPPLSDRDFGIFHKFFQKNIGVLKFFVILHL